MMVRQLTARQRAFAAKYVELGTGRAAALAAGYAAASAAKTASALLADQRIRQLIDGAYTIERCISDVESAAAVAAETKDAGSMLTAITLRAQLAGLLVQAKPTTQDMVTQ